MSAKITYNQNYLNYLKNELAQLEAKENAQVLLLNDHKRFCTQYKNGLAGLQAEIESLNGVRSHLSTSEVHAIEALENRLGFLMTEVEESESRLRFHSEGLSKTQRLVDSLGEQIHSLKAIQADVGAFLYALGNAPDQLVLSLEEKVFSALSDYEDKHFASLSPEIRACLFILRHNLKEIYQYDDVTDRDIDYRTLFHSPQRQSQINYLRLSGLLYGLHHRAQQAGEEDFANLLLQLAKETYIDKQADLPDEMNTGWTAQSCYEKIQGARPQLFLLQKEDLQYIEARRLAQELDELIALSATKADPLSFRVCKAAKMLKIDLEQRAKKKEKIDFYLCYTTVHNLKALLDNPNDFKAASNLNTLAQHMYFNKVTFTDNQMLLLTLVVTLGACICSAGFIGFTLSIASPAFCAYAMVLGLNLLQAQCAMTLASSAVMVSGIGCSFWGVSSVARTPTLKTQKLLTEVMEVLPEQEEAEIHSNNLRN